LDSTLMILQNRFKANGSQRAVEVIKEYGDLPLVECYPSQLNQVFMNLVSNAIDALEEIRLTAATALELAKQPTIRIRTQLTGDRRVAVYIADNGPGVPLAAQQKLFDPFFTTKEIGKGTGLGLSISYQIAVDQHGGELRCVSAPGQGAMFVIEVPLEQGKLEQEEIRGRGEAVTTRGGDGARGVEREEELLTGSGAQQGVLGLKKLHD
ncbi:MAG: hypothetical protein F6K04_05810, partial [Leptolyngbya sp. SIO4C5]|nr:hypothetical protein [Leptolyngbya sp. SIO4C5]